MDRRRGPTPALPQPHEAVAARPEHAADRRPTSAAGRTRPSWSSLAQPDARTHDALLAAREHATRLVACGDAVVVAPLERSLAALDLLSLRRTTGHPVVADYWRHELIVLVPAGSSGARVRTARSGCCSW
ncbi:hypothetical protein AB0I22_33635 [Streptomyces sp. NPDC050610]|uniref:hypothetical protein n=1 Tax=Streptomyces sp. NPDC050610 TaxID=3157097 RepID=UPI00342A5B83